MSVQGEIWLVLLKKGGRWSAAEVAAELPGYDKRRCAQILKCMYDQGYVRRYERNVGNAKRVQYAVVQTCKVPHMVTIAEILACILAQLPEESADADADR
jgi:hypothetical protein